MNDSYEMLLKRRTIRAFRPDAIPDETLKKILTAGKYAPSAMGMQNRHFTVIRNQDLLKDIVTATEQNGGKFRPGHTPFYGAPCVIVLSAPVSFALNREDAACALQNILLASYALGLGSCYICSVLPGLRDPAILARLSLPAGYAPYGCVSLGFPAEEAAEPKPRRTDDITFL